MSEALSIFRAPSLGSLTQEQQEQLDEAVAADVARFEFLKALPTAVGELERRKHEALSFVYSVPVQGVLEHQITLLRRHAFALTALSMPSEFTGSSFDGGILPPTPDGVRDVLSAFVLAYAKKAAQAEKVIAHYDSKIEELTRCDTRDDVLKVRW